LKVEFRKPNARMKQKMESQLEKKNPLEKASVGDEISYAQSVKSSISVDSIRGWQREIRS
ncbi:hypothetical protein GW17_00057004, partial [Ensete ventricosum]